MTEIIHSCPPDGSGLTPCCGRTFAETPGERQTTNPEHVTCGKGGEADGPAVATDNPAPELREQIAEALMAWAERNNAPQYAAMRRPDTVRQNAYGRADAVLAVPAIQQLQAEVNGWRHKAIQRAIRLGRHETTLAELRVFAAEEVTARNGWGDGYRDALRDLTELLDTLAPSDEPAALDPQEQP